MPMHLFYCFPSDNWRLCEVNPLDDLQTEDGLCRLQPLCVRNEPQQQCLAAPKQSVRRGELSSADPMSLPTSLKQPKDLLQLLVLDGANILHHVRQRYWNDDIYSTLGPITLAVNPFRRIDSLSVAYMHDYIKVRGDLAALDSKPANLWTVAHRTYYEMLQGKPQSILVSGESGAGKTESCKVMLHYIAELSTSFQAENVKNFASTITGRILQASPILEAFGNARTVCNDNSSRFGKFMKLKFDRQTHYLYGCETQVYLLEKNRAVAHNAGERSYHIYYQLLAGASPEQRQRYRLGDGSQFQWLYHGIPKQQQPEKQDRQAFLEVMEAFRATALSSTQVEAILDLIASVLHLQTIEFVPDKNGTAALSSSDQEIVQFVCDLWGLPQGSHEQLQKTLTTTLVVDAVRPLTLQQARYLRDSISKAIYEGVFLWIVQELNAAVGGDSEKDEGQHWIGLLDLFGFENFFPAQPNTLEQLLINYANEQLQEFYNECVQDSMNEYALEDLDMTGLTMELPNSRTVKEAVRTIGTLLQLLADQNYSKNGTNSAFLSQLLDSCKGNKDSVLLPPRADSEADSAKPRLQRNANEWNEKTVFGLKHFAQTVWYSPIGDGEGGHGWMQRNLENVPDVIRRLFRSASNLLLRDYILAEAPNRGKPPTVGLVFRKSLQNLMGLLRQTDPNWVRCIKPSPLKAPHQFLGDKVYNQLLTVLPMLDAVQTKEKGYPKAMLHRDFCLRYQCLFRAFDAEAAAQLLSNFSRKSLAQFIERFGTKEFGQWSLLQDGQVGKTRVYLKASAYNQLESARGLALRKEVVILQIFIRACFSIRLAIRRKLRRHLKRAQNAFRLKMRKQVSIQERILSTFYKWQHQEEERRRLSAPATPTTAPSALEVEDNFQLPDGNDHPLEEEEEVVLHSEPSIVAQEMEDKDFLIRKLRNKIEMLASEVLELRTLLREADEECVQHLHTAQKFEEMCQGLDVIREQNILLMQRVKDLELMQASSGRLITTFLWSLWEWFCAFFIGG